MSEEHDDVFKELERDLEQWLASVRDWKRLASKTYTLEQLKDLFEEFQKTAVDSGVKQFLEWMEKREIF